MIETKTPRVASTARIPGIKGSNETRAQMAYAKNEAFFEEISDIYVKNNEITLDEAAAAIKKHYPSNIQFAIGPKTSNRYEGVLRTSIINNVASSYTMEVPIIERNGKKVINTLNPVDLLCHEARHFFDNIMNSKFTARRNITKLDKKLSGFKERSKEYQKFYDNYLYPYGLGERSLAINQLSSKDKAENHIPELKKKIMEIFNKPQVTTEEKIEILQDWRHGLKTERNAYEDGANFQHKTEIKKQIKETKENTTIKAALGMTAEEFRAKLLEIKARELKENKYKNDDFGFLNDRIKLLEELLKEEIQKARKGNTDKVQKETKKVDKIAKTIVIGAIAATLAGCVYYIVKDKQKEKSTSKAYQTRA
jgi:hypothetical protein